MDRKLSIEGWTILWIVMWIALLCMGYTPNADSGGGGLVVQSLFQSEHTAVDAGGTRDGTSENLATPFCAMVHVAKGSPLC